MPSTPTDWDRRQALQPTCEHAFVVEDMSFSAPMVVSAVHLVCPYCGLAKTQVPEITEARHVAV